MKEVNYIDVSKQIQRQLSKGSFLTVKDKDGNVNTMTIAWGNLGFMWKKPVFTVMVRYSRHTYKLIENADDFTVSFPTGAQLKKELSFCGSKSGRDIDKFKELNLKILDGKRVNSPIIADCDISLECKIIYKQALDPSGMGEYVENVYGEEKDYHVLYYGEILSCFVND
jgi:flavin reductase (DIM6/NTAB) family NADH-FMN oxidoreductase RutF